ncbi:TonB-dependent receptor [Fretibacter rubidus]|uniref:TonB-dependent receptor n=1 Tax=Fretibacter rubidus TaxID=570162 RepID=UPI00352A7C1A
MTTPSIFLPASQSKFKPVLKAALLLSVGASTLAFSQAAVAQDNDPDEVIVTGTRQVIQDAIALKRQSTQIVDGLSASEIGDLPALSIGEALETVTGVASHRENGGATEVSIRGLGPYLSSTTFNGREATNGSGDRSVNFSMFPSELMSKLAIFKTQDASQIEGGVAGQIQLETLKPLDYGKRRFQFDLKGNVNPDQLDQKDTLAGDIGFRGTASYVDQWDMTGGGSVGLAIGVQRSDISQPEQEVRSTSNTSGSSFACVINSPLNQGFGSVATSRDDDCEDQNSSRTRDDGSRIPDGYDTTINPATGLAYSDGEDFVFVPSQRHYRQNDTRDQRDAIFAALQFQPSDSMDINFDVQYSNRDRTEERNDLTFNGQKRNDRDIDLPGNEGTSTLELLERNPSGAITSFTTDNTIEIQGGDWAQNEEYLGGGVNVSVDITNRLNMTADVSYSRTERTEQELAYRIQSNITPVIQWDSASGIPQYRLFNDEFDVADPTNFVDRLRIRIDNDLLRRNTSTAGRLDFTYDLENTGMFKGLEFGGRYSSLEFLGVAGGDRNDGTRTEIEIRDNNGGRLYVNSGSEFDSDLRGAPGLLNIIANSRDACGQDFPETNFLSSIRDGDLVQNFDSDGNLLSSRNSWAVLDTTCLVNTAIDSLNDLNGVLNGLLSSGDDLVPLLSAGIPSLTRETSSTVDVTENVTAFYAMTNYETQMGAYPVRGNIGVRLVNTEIESVGFRQAFNITNENGAFNVESAGASERVVSKFDYTEILPSANAIIDLNDTTLMRLGVFKAISRADPSDMGFNRNISFVDTDDDENPITSLDGLISGVTTSGNPAFKPLTSWNFDAGVEWYPNEDSIFAVGAYYKRFRGGFENVVQNETYTVGGQELTFPVSVQQVNEDTNNLYGFEVTASHRFSYLPGALSGFGTKLSYNYADTDFEFEDSLYGDQFTRGLDGTVTQTNAGIVPAASIPGLSEHVFSGQVYYQIGDLDLQGIYKYRSDYFQPFISNGTRIRLIGDTSVFEARASYKLNDNFRVSVEAINLFDEPKRQFKWVPDDIYEVNSYGPRIFFGIRGKF